MQKAPPWRKGVELFAFDVPSAHGAADLNLFGKPVDVRKITKKYG